MSSEELFLPKFVCQSAFIDWNRLAHDSYVVAHSSDAVALCDLLNRAEAVQLGQEITDINSQLNMSSLFPGKKKGGKAKEKPVDGAKPKKKGKEEIHGMDIRECMAVAADKARLTQEKLLNKESIDVLDLTEPYEVPLPSQISSTPYENNKQPPENCTFCHQNGETNNNMVSEFDKQPFPFSLNQLFAVEKLVQNLSLDDINKIDVSQLFISDCGFSSKVIEENILSIKQGTLRNMTNEPGFLLNELNDKENFNNQETTLINVSHHSPPNFRNNKANSPKSSNNAEREKESFNIEDIFTDDDFDVDFNTKTSTPLKQPTSLTISSHIDPVMKINQTLSEDKCTNYFELNGSVNTLNNKSKPIFKIPQLKLNYHLSKSPKAAKHETVKNYQIKSPGSPVLSGKISSTIASTQHENEEQKFLANYSTHSNDIKISSPESPILSGQITKISPLSKHKHRPSIYDKLSNFDKNTKISSPESPLSSGQIIMAGSSSKHERRDLFYNDKLSSSYKNPRTSSPESPILSGQIKTASYSPKHSLNPQIHDQTFNKNFKISSPHSPILPGQITSPNSVSKLKHNTLFSNNCSQKNSKILSPESPILSGHIITKSPPSKHEHRVLFPDNRYKFDRSPSPVSPILSGQITTSTAIKPDRRVLFPEAYSNICKLKTSSLVPHILMNEDEEKSLMCKPLDSFSNSKQNIPASEVSENVITASQIFYTEPVENVNNISVSQLFDDSSNEETDNKITVSQIFEDNFEEDKMDDTSMFTISQMIAKVEERQNKNKQTADVEAKNKLSVNQSKNNSLKFGNDDEDSILANIDLDNISVLGQDAPLKPNKLPEHDSIKLSVIKECDESLDVVNKKQANNYCNVNKSVYFSNCEVLNKLSNDSISSLESNFHNYSSNNTSTLPGQPRKTGSKWLSRLALKNKNKNFETKLPLDSTFKSVNSIPPEEESDSNSDASLFIGCTKEKRGSKIERKESKCALKTKKVKGFVEFEADVSGAQMSSDEENTSGLDDLDESFINDHTEMPLTPSHSTTKERSIVDMQSHYLQSVKSPFHKAGGYKIPKISDTVLAMDVFSQVENPDQDSYLNDSFCCDESEIPVDNDPSVLEVAEKILDKKRKTRKRKRRISNASSDSSFESGQIHSKKAKKRMWQRSESSSDNDSKFVHNLKSVKRRNLITDSSPESLLPSKVQTSSSRIQRPNRLNSEDSDSDKTP